MIGISLCAILSVAANDRRKTMRQVPTTGPWGSALRQPRLSRVEEKELFRRLHLGDRAAATQLVTSHLRFVLHIARRYNNHEHSLSDLIQEGTVGLLEAVKRFNPERDVQLSTYAMWWIRAAIQDYVVRSRSLVKIGTTAAQKSLFLNLRRRIGELVDGEGLNVSLEALRFTIQIQPLQPTHQRLNWSKAVVIWSLADWAN